MVRCGIKMRRLSHGIGPDGETCESLIPRRRFSGAPQIRVYPRGIGRQPLNPTPKTPRC